MKKNNNVKLSLIGLLSLLAVSCSDDNNTASERIDNTSGQVSNELMTLTYGKSLLSHNVQLKNTLISFIRSATTRSSSDQSVSIISSYQEPNFTNAIRLTGSNGVNVDIDNAVYYIPQGEEFSGEINFNRKATMYVLGTLSGSNNVNVQNDSKVVVAPSGAIVSSVGLQLNNNSTLDNYGAISYKNGSVNGTINNYGQMTFTGDVSLNNNSVVNNYCALFFQAFTQLNTSLSNNGYVDFRKGLHVNSNGTLLLGAGSLTDITGGTIGVDGKIKNESQGIARIDISNGVTIQNMNASPAFTGKLDINTNLVFADGKIGNSVILNGNSYIASKGCGLDRGIRPCDPSTLQFELLAEVSSPAVGNTILSATDVRVNNGRAYVSYHTNDEFYDNTPNGALRVFDIQNQKAPALISEATFKDIEFNGIDITNNDLYAVGGNKNGARIAHTSLIDGTLPIELSNYNQYSINGFAAKNSFFYNNMLWLVSGGTSGGFFKLDPQNNYSSTTLYSNGARAKYVVMNASKQVFFAVEPTGAYLRVSDLNGNNAEEYRYPSLAQNITTGKNVITTDDSYIYVSLSDKGVAKIDLNTGALVHHFQPNKYIDESTNRLRFKSTAYTNGVAVNDCFVFLANGGHGVIVLGKDNLNFVGSFRLSESANFVYVKDGLLFVATGRNGLNIIKIN